jgi:hypothetical protein
MTKKEMKKLRSNSKEVKEAIRLHLVEISENDDVEVETVEQAIKYIGDRFYDEILEYDNSCNSIQELFIYWLNGLALHTYYYTDDIINYLHSIGLYGKDEKQEQEKSAYLYHYLIFKEVKDHIFKML